MDEASELHESERWAAADEARQDEIARAVLKSLPGWTWAGAAVYPLPGSRDDAPPVRIVSFREEATGFVFQLLPGASAFPLGFSDEEEAKLRRLADAFPLGSDDRLPAEAGAESVENKPVRRVRVRPFLLMRDPVMPEQAARLLDISPEDAEGDMEGLGVAGFDSDGVEAILTATGHALASEAQWEYACRGGIPGRLFPWGDTVPRGDEWLDANPYGRSPSTPERIARATNRFGLVGMGAWAELCADIYRDGYDGAPLDDSPHLDPPEAEDEDEEPLRVLRGGAALCYPWQGVGEWAYMLCALRLDEGSAEVGFNLRLARPLPHG